MTALREHSHHLCRQVKPGEPWFEGCLSGVGDCAHATRPDLGQGGAMAIEVHVCQSALADCLLSLITLVVERMIFSNELYAERRAAEAVIEHMYMYHWYPVKQIMPHMVISVAHLCSCQHAKCFSQISSWPSILTFVTAGCDAF